MQYNTYCTLKVAEIRAACLMQRALMQHPIQVMLCTKELHRLTGHEKCFFLYLQIITIFFFFPLSSTGHCKFSVFKLKRSTCTHGAFSEFWNHVYMSMLSKMGFLQLSKPEHNFKKGPGQSLVCSLQPVLLSQDLHQLFGHVVWLLFRSIVPLAIFQEAEKQGVHSHAVHAEEA